MPHFPDIKLINGLVLSPASAESIGRELSSFGLAASLSTWPTANKAFFIPVTVYEPLTIVKMFIENGSVAAGNVDVGLYNLNGTRIVSSGAILQSGTTALQEFEIVDTRLQAGYYYLAHAMSNVTGTCAQWSPTAAYAKLWGVAEQASAFPLPANAVIATLTANRIPAVFATTRAII